jgi:hypothetical protein
MCLFRIIVDQFSSDQIMQCLVTYASSSSIGTTAHCGLWPVGQDPSIFSCHQLSPSLLNPSNFFLCSTFVTISFLLCGVVSPTPNPQPWGPGYPFRLGQSPLTCLAWEALPVAYATASIALGIMWQHKPHHYVKVGIPSGGVTYAGMYWWKVKIKLELPRYRSGVAQRVGRGLALLFHDNGARRWWVVSSTPRPYFTPGKDPVNVKGYRLCVCVCVCVSYRKNMLATWLIVPIRWPLGLRRSCSSLAGVAGPSVVCCHVEVPAMGRSLIQGSPTECVCVCIYMLLSATRSNSNPRHLKWVGRNRSD